MPVLSPQRATNFHRCPKLYESYRPWPLRECCNLSVTATTAWRRNYKDLYGKKRFLLQFKNANEFSIKISLPELPCLLLFLLCGFWSDLAIPVSFSSIAFLSVYIPYWDLFNSSASHHFSSMTPTSNPPPPPPPSSGSATNAPASPGMSELTLTVSEVQSVLEALDVTKATRVHR